MLEPQELRLECLKLALSTCDNIEESVKGASLLLEFLQGSCGSRPCDNGSIKLSAISGLWECDECGCLPGSKLVSGHTKEEHEEAAGMPLEPAFMAKGYYGHELGCDCAMCENMMLGEARRKREA